MCGVVGIIGKADVSFDLYKSMLALQHRGQDSAGISVFNGTSISTKKEVGLVTQVFNDENLSLLKGEMGIGHVRYATAGSNPKNDAHPFTLESPRQMALAFNGNIVNHKEVRSNREYTNCDAETLLHMLSDGLAGKEITPETIFESVGAIMEKANGGYSTVCLIEGLGLLAFRDPNAIRPLAMGKNNEGAIAFASETVAFDSIGFDYVRNIKPGEAVFVTNSLQVHEKSIRPMERRHCMFEWVYFARPDSVIEGQSVYEARIALGTEAGKLLKKNGEEVVVAVPDTSRIAALALGRHLNLPIEEGLIKNRYIGRTFIMPTHGERESALKVKFNSIGPVIQGKEIFLVDDSIVRGSTAKKIVKEVKKKAKSVHFVSTCPPIKNPCYYGIDFPIKEELIAVNKSVEEIKQELGVDGLTYMTMEGLKESLKQKGICTGCLDGNYPTKITPEMERQIVEGRKKARGG